MLYHEYQLPWLFLYYVNDRLLFTADVYRDGTGVVEFARVEDLDYALKHFQDSKFRSHEVSPRIDSSGYKVPSISDTQPDEVLAFYRA